MASVELATILLTDLVGSTELAATVGPERVDELLDEHFTVLRDAIESSRGREVKTTGDGLMVAFSSASAAVRCAVTMQQLLERHYRHAEQTLHVRIGLGAGESRLQGGDYFGMPSIAAARLCAKAPSDGILVSSTVRVLAERLDNIEFESVGELELKGFPEPVNAFAVLWQPLEDESGGSHSGWAGSVQFSVPMAGYVGRAAERARIDRARAAARNGSRRVVLLSGEPGIGKTRLAAHAAQVAQRDGFSVLWDGCSEELAMPYEPWIGVCSGLIDHAPKEFLDGYVERFGGELRRLAGNLPRRVPDLPPPQPSDPETERFLLFAAVAGLLRSACQSSPVCLVLDDLHWGDGQTVALLKHVARTVNQAPLLLIATYRDSDLAKDHPLTGVLADLRQMEGVERIALQGLGVDHVSELMSAAVGHELDAGGITLASKVAAQTGGNPFFVGEILRSLVESELLVFDDATGRWSIDGSASIHLPQGVRDVIDGRVRRLGEETRQLLVLAAVIGQSFDVELLSKLIDTSEAVILDRLEAAVGAALLAESRDRVGRFSFAHALIKQCLYEGLGTTRRAKLHHRVAVALEQLGAGEAEAGLPELALHWRLATAPAASGKAAEYARRAGRQALASLAPAEAARLFRDAIELTREIDTVEGCQALIGLGEAQRQTGDGAYRDTLLEASRVAYKLGDAELAASAVLANSSGAYSFVGDVDAARLQAIEKAIELDDPPSPARRARLLALEALELGWDPDVHRRRALADEAVRLARAAGDARALAEVLHNAVRASTSADTLGLRVGLAKEMMQSAEAAQDPALQFWAYVGQFTVMLEQAEFRGARVALERMELAARELGQPLLTWNAAYSRAGWTLPRGHIAAAEQLAEHALQVGRQAGEPNAILIYGSQLAFLRAYQGRGDEVVATLEQSVAAYPRVSGWRAGLASCYCLVGRRSQAAEIVEQAARDRFADVYTDQARTTALALYADAAYEAKLPGAAAILYELVEPWSDQVAWNGATMFGHATMWLGLLSATLGRHERADKQLALACKLQEADGLLLWAARAYLGWAESLLHRGEQGMAKEKAARALELARENGWAVFEARAEAIVAAQAREPRLIR